MMNVNNDCVHVDTDDHEGDKVQKLAGTDLFIQWLKILYRGGHVKMWVATKTHIGKYW